jgi:ubiquinone/menaquinone biosynthesis C-methylase UbiE
MADNVGKKWQKAFTHASYSTPTVPKEFFLRLQQSPYLTSMLAYSGLKKGDKVLEAGCGSGKWAVTLATLGYEVTAMDYAPTILKQVDKLLKQAENYFGKLKLKTMVDDLNDLKTKDEYGLVFNEGVVEHWLAKDERQHVIKQMTKVTRKGGTVAIFVPNGAHPLHFWWVVSHYSGYFSAPPMTRYSTRKLKKEMTQVGLKSVQTNGFDAYFSVNKWPHLKTLDYPLGYLEKHYPLPKVIREGLGTSIVCFGKK